MSIIPNDYTLEELENRVAELFAERSALQRKIAGKDARIAELEAACQEWNTEVVRYQARIALLEKELKQERYLTQFYKSWAIEAGVPPIEPEPIDAGYLQEPAP